MTMQQRALPLLKNIFILSLIAVISACGGGGKKKDLIPDNFSFTAVTGAAVSTEVTSNTITVMSINKPVSISITGGTYAIGSGAFTGATGTVTKGQTVKVKVMTSASNSTAVTSTLTIGGVTGSFSVTTIAADATPNEFLLPAVTGAQPGSVNTSAAVTVAGINVTVPISIVGGEYSINGGTYTSSAGTVTAAQTVTVRVTADTTPSAAKDVVLTIGGVSATYKVTTIADAVAPTAQILFPPVVSMTEGNTILVRGTASDTYSIKSVKVNGVTATTTDSFANWQALVPLTDTTAPVTATTENTITVVTEDNAGNIATDAAHVAIRQAPLTSSFPDADNPFTDIFKIVIDRQNGKNRLLTTTGFSGSTIMSIDLTTGKRSVFKQIIESGVSTITGIQIDPIANRLYLGVNNGASGRVMALDLITGETLALSPLYGGTTFGLLLDDTTSVPKIVATNGIEPASIITTDSSLASFTILSDATHPNSENLIGNSYSIILDKSHDRYLVADDFYADQAIIAVNRLTGARSVFSSNAVGTGDMFASNNSGWLDDLVLDEANQRVIALENDVGSAGIGIVLGVDLATGNRTILSTTSDTNPFNSMRIPYGIALNGDDRTLYASDHSLKTIFAIDLVTGYRVVFSKN
ncbi:MAG: hypothetical protein V4732_13415 [Pseudomonadota bacterium]